MEYSVMPGLGLEHCSIGHVFDSHLVLGYFNRTSSSEVERWIAVLAFIPYRLIFIPTRWSDRKR